MVDVIVFEVYLSCALSVIMLLCLDFKVLFENMSFCPTITSAIYKQSSFPNQKVVMALVSSCVQRVVLLCKPGRASDS